MKSVSKSDILYLDLAPKTCLELEEQALGKVAALYKSTRIIKDEVFKILADNSILLQYPIEDDEICGFVCCKKERIFSYVNSYIPYEKQVFAAAHELYHIWFDKDILTTGELLSSDVIDLALDKGLSEREARANRFAAILLVPEQVLKNELAYMGIESGDKIELGYIIKLMDQFKVPYKTMVRRLYEIAFIDYEMCLNLIQIPDRDESTGIRALQKRMQLGEDLNNRTKEIRFSGLIHNAILAYENGKSTEEKLIYLLSLVRMKPEEFGIKLENNRPTEEELLELLENE